MPGNELKVIEYILRNKSKLAFPHVGKLRKFEIPRNKKRIEITNIKDVKKFSADDSYKKADVFINGKGISIKQFGGNVAYNKIQRKTLFNFLNKFFTVKKTSKIIYKLDKKIIDFHSGIIKRDVQIDKIMSKKDFKIILKYLMLKGSTTKESSFPAQLILVAKKKINSFKDFNLLNFEDYYKNYIGNIVFGIRRCWVGMLSNSEHRRALSISTDKLNKLWCFNNVSGKPRGNLWRIYFPKKKRKTVFYVNLIQN